MYKILLTGHTGFIGSHLIKYLDKLGYECESISKEEFMNEDFHRLDDFGFDILTPEDKAYEKAHPTIIHPDIVVHCAWPKLDLHSTDHLEFAEMSCNFFNECKKRGIRVINLGSSSEYGVKYEPMKENMVCEPINTYGIAKLAVTLYAKKLGFNTLRLFTVYGEGDGHSFADVFGKSQKLSDRWQVRDYINIQWVCLAIQRLMHADHLYGEIINVCSGEQFTNEGIIKKLDKVKIDTQKWDQYPQTQYEPRSWIGDTTKQRRLLNL